MKRALFLFILSLCSIQAFTQYWFGPKLGVSYIDHVYQESTYESDSFNIPKDLNFQAGVAVSYAANGRYAVYGELTYERIGKEVSDKETGGNLVKASMTNHFLTAPIMLRVTIGRVPFHYYVNGGPRLAYWLGGNGTLDLDEFAEFPPAGQDEDGNPLPVEYRVTFNSSKALEGDREVSYVSKPNRLQFGLTLGAGILLDLQGGSRLQFDFRYTWVHSNMALNNGVNDINFQNETYRENFEYFNNIATVGVAYLIEYNTELKRKGKSTNKESNKRKK